MHFVLPSFYYSLHQSTQRKETIKNATPKVVYNSGTEKLERKYGKNMRRLMKLVSQAFLNPIEIPWDVEEYYVRHVKGGRDKKRIKFPNPSFGKFSEPLTVVDSKGRIVLWYLPGLLSHEQLSNIESATVSIEPLLQKSVQLPLPNKSTPNWRTHNANFVPISLLELDLIEPGAVTFSSGWFGQGHETNEYPLLPSLNLRSQHRRETSDWLQISNDVEKFINLTLSLIHPDMFRMGLEMLRKLRGLEQTKDIAKLWQSVFTGMSIICNRLTPLHRDSKGRPEWFDVLLHYSETGSFPRLFIDDIGLNLQYSSGTVVGFCGSVFRHGVQSWGEGNRICYAHFMRESVRARLDVPPAEWVYRNKYHLTETQIGQSDDNMIVDMQDIDNDAMGF